RMAREVERKAIGCESHRDTSFLLLLFAEDDDTATFLTLNTLSFLIPLSHSPLTARPRTDGFWEDIFPYLTDEDNDDTRRARSMRRTLGEIALCVFLTTSCSCPPPRLLAHRVSQQSQTRLILGK